MAITVAQLFRLIRGRGLATPPPPTGGGGGGGGTAPPITLAASQVKCHEPKEIAILGNLATVTSSDLATIDATMPGLPNGFGLSPARNVVQWDASMNDDAGTVTYHLSDGVATVAVSIEKLMNLYLPGVEKSASVGTPVAWLYGFHGSVRPTLGGAAATYFEFKGWNIGARWYWWLAVKASLSALSAPSALAYTIASSGLTTINGTVDILADTGAVMSGWADPIAPAAPLSPLTTRSSTLILNNGTTRDREDVTGVALPYKQNVALLSNISLTNISGDSVAIVMRNSGGSGLTNFTVSKVAITNGRYLQGIGHGGVRIGNNPCNNILVEDLSWVSIPGGAYATSENDISGGACIQGKDPTRSYAGNVTFQRIHVDGLYMNSTDASGGSIFMNGDGCATERYHSWLGPITITDVWFKGADACVDCKAITGTVIARLRHEGGHYCIKDWTGNTWDCCKGISVSAYHIQCVAIGATPLRAVRRYGTAQTDAPLVNFETLPSAVLISKYDIPGGIQMCHGETASLGSFVALPDGTGLYQSGSNSFAAFTPV